MRFPRLLILLLIATACFSSTASALSRRDKAYEAARTFVPPFLGKLYARAATVTTFDPATRESWFETRFPAHEPFKLYQVFAVDRNGDTSLVHVRIRGETAVYGLYLRVDSRGKITDVLSIRELLHESQSELDAAAGRTEQVLDGIEARSLPPSSMRGAFREHRRAAAQYLHMIEKHLDLLEGKDP